MSALPSVTATAKYTEGETRVRIPAWHDPFPQIHYNRLNTSLFKVLLELMGYWQVGCGVKFIFIKKE